MAQKTLDTQPAEKPLTEWEQIVLKLINGELEVIKKDEKIEEYIIAFNYNEKEYAIWICDPDITHTFGTLYEVNGKPVEEVIREKTQIRPEIQEKLKVFVKPTDNEILQKFEEKHFKL